MLKVVFQRGNIAVDPGNNPLWTVIRKSQKPEGYKLVEGDVIRIGRSVFRVKKLSTNNQSRAVYPESSPSPSIFLQDPSFDLESLLCRLCSQGFLSSSDPLISPCHCTDQLTHLSCMREFIRTRLEIRANGSSCAYFWRDMECEVCKSVFQTSVSIGEEEFDLLNVVTPAGPHIVLEDLRTAGQVAKGVHVVGMSDEQRCRFGRAQACEVVLSDVSVARFHASIRLSKGAYYLEDLDSKFGTAVLLRNQLLLQAGGAVTMQSDAVVVTIRLMRPFRFRRYLCCFYSRDREVETRDQVRAEGNGCGLALADIETDKVALGDPGTTLRSDHA